MWLGCGDGPVSLSDAPRTPEDARAELERQGIAYTTTVFGGAAVVGDLEVIQLFVQAGMSVRRHIDSWADWTVLHVAAHHGHLAVVKYLVENEAILTARTGYRTDGDTAAGLAAKAGHFEIVKYLESKYLDSQGG